MAYSAKIKFILDILKQRLSEIAHFNYILAVLGWDIQVNLPPKGVEQRSKAMAYLSSISHEKFLGIDQDKILTNLKNLADQKKINQKDHVIVNETWRSYERARKLPVEFVKELAEITAQGNVIWAQARAKSDFKLFAPTLKKILNLKRLEAKYLGFEKTPYDPIIEGFEPGMTVDELSIVFEELKQFLMSFMARIRKSKVKIEPEIISGDFSVLKQVEFNNLLLKEIGFDFEAGRFDTSTHPFTSGFHPFDVRLTNRYDPTNIFSGITGTMHEAGHALYEQGLLPESYGTPLGESISLGIHESQSRIWENMIGKSLDFWKFLHPFLKKEFPAPFKNVSIMDLYKVVNRVKPSLIRVESDEVTYNLHIILRFEIEKELIGGSIEVEDLPKIWNAKMKEYLGVKVPNDKLGVLQDVHWSEGMFGYFPTYTLGNLYSAQFYSAARKNIPDLDKQIRTGNFLHFREWLRQNIHQHGKYYSAAALAREVTGEPLSSSYYIDYLQSKYSQIYDL